MQSHHDTRTGQPVLVGKAGMRSSTARMSAFGRFLPVGIPLANQSRTLVGRSKLTGCGCNDPNLKHTLSRRLLDPVARHPPSRPGLGRLGWPPEVWRECVA
jgi:hypothetical protein